MQFDESDTTEEERSWEQGSFVTWKARVKPKIFKEGDRSQ